MATILLLGLTGLLAMTPVPVAPSWASPDSVLSPGSALLGLSGKLRAIATMTEAAPGVHRVGLLAPDGAAIHELAQLPLEMKQASSWRGYRIGFWPGEQRARATVRYPLPEGFLEVTPETQDVALSQRFRLRDFLTHDQADVWPKVLVVRLPLVDKLELIADRLVALGRPGAVRVMSGFRTPQYNAQGVGPRGGRAGDSRHMYGDAADIFVDADGDGRMDDLTGDSRVTIADARWLAVVVDEVGRLHPELVGGIGVYRANAVHGPFVHVDVRGTLARW